MIETIFGINGSRGIAEPRQPKEQYKHMGQRNPNFAPLDPQRAQELEWVIDKAAQSNQVVVIDPDEGLKGVKAMSLISPNANTNGLVRFGRHYV
jgi:hypothetical protein